MGTDELVAAREKRDAARKDMQCKFRAMDVVDYDNNAERSRLHNIYMAAYNRYQDARDEVTAIELRLKEKGKSVQWSDEMEAVLADFEMAIAKFEGLLQAHQISRVDRLVLLEEVVRHRVLHYSDERLPKLYDMIADAASEGDRNNDNS